MSATAIRALAEIEAEKALKIVSACKQFTDRLPTNYLLYVGGSEAGRKLPFQIDDSNAQATQFEVFVNEPGRDVVLAFGTNAPSIWSIKWTVGTRIAGVFLTGAHVQHLIGLPETVPVLISTSQTRGGCGYFHIDKGAVTGADALMREHFGRSADAYFIARDGVIEIGAPKHPATPWIQLATKTPEDFRIADLPPAGTAGLEELIRQGRLRPATQDDIDAWRASGGRKGAADGLLDHPFLLQRTYVVLAKMRYPAGLFGAHAVRFIIARGVLRPDGDPGHSAVMDMNYGTCAGAMCNSGM